MYLEDNGIYITEKLSEKYGLDIGDEISWHIFGDDTWYICKIVGINRDPQSQILNMTRKYYESLSLKYRADSLYTNDDLSNVKTLEGVDTMYVKHNENNDCYFNCCFSNIGICYYL